MFPNSRAAVFLLGIVSTILVGWVLHVGAGILQPLVIALLLASMLQPVVRWMARRHIPPPVTVILIVTLIFLGVARVGLLIEANVRWLFRQGQIERVDSKVPANGRTPEDVAAVPSEQQEQVTGDHLDPLSHEQQERIKEFRWDNLVENFHAWMLEREFPEELARLARESLREAEVETLAPAAIGSGLGFIRGLVLVVIYMLFIFAEQAVFRRKILSIFEERREDARSVLDNIGRGIQRYLGVKTVVSFVTGAVCYSALVALDVPFALLLGFLTFALNYIPTFGSIIAGAVATFVAIVTMEEPGLATPLAVVITFVTVNLVLGNYIEPKILGRELNLSPLVVIISVVVWAGLWGPVGALLAVPLTATLQIILASNESTRPIAVMLSSGPPKEKKSSKKQPPSIQAA